MRSAVCSTDSHGWHEVSSVCSSSDLRAHAGWSPIVAFVLVLVDDIGMLSVCEVYEVDGVLAPMFEYNHVAE